ncbi:hypothetical protein SAMN06296273_1845 [Nitrosomonas ureae]|uniref:Uncharacterized protein n=1 Tax=Nitrosomonas ureae TaxID=44577 RepID=A0A285BZZ1_9PROT|nr:hypothetical protein [Nitrosomonas ureae]SNX60383.1 hypothetical protein SAMN06296273_1845 [Nitrosomonas ureae]
MPVTIDMKGIEVIPTPKIKLANIEDCRREMASVYRDARSGRIDSQDGSRLVYMLSQVSKLIELSDIEKRIEVLENLNNG